MRKNKIIYVFDAYCSWCYGMGPVMEKVAEKYKDTLEFEAISGGMIPEDTSIKTLATKFDNPRKSYNQVMKMTGQTISDDYINMLESPDEYENTFNSLYPARAMVTLKHFTPDHEFQQADAIQELLFSHTKDLTKTSSYKTVAEKFAVDWEAFVHRFESEESLEEAKYEFHLSRQLEVTSYPAVLLQTGDQYFYLIARGYTPFDTLDQRIQNVLSEKSKENGIAPSENGKSNS